MIVATPAPVIVRNLTSGSSFHCTQKIVIIVLYYLPSRLGANIWGKQIADTAKRLTSWSLGRIIRTISSDKAFKVFGLLSSIFALPAVRSNSTAELLAVKDRKHRSFVCKRTVLLERENAIAITRSRIVINSAGLRAQVLKKFFGLRLSCAFLKSRKWRIQAPLTGWFSCSKTAAAQTVAN